MNYVHPIIFISVQSILGTLLTSYDHLRSPNSPRPAAGAGLAEEAPGSPATNGEILPVMKGSAYKLREWEYIYIVTVNM